MKMRETSVERDEEEARASSSSASRRITPKPSPFRKISAPPRPSPSLGSSMDLRNASYKFINHIKREIVERRSIEAHTEAIGAVDVPSGRSRPSSLIPYLTFHYKKPTTVLAASGIEAHPNIFKQMWQPITQTTSSNHPHLCKDLRKDFEAPLQSSSNDSTVATPSPTRASGAAVGSRKGITLPIRPAGKCQTFAASVVSETKQVPSLLKNNGSATAAISGGKSFIFPKEKLARKVRFSPQVCFAKSPLEC